MSRWTYLIPRIIILTLILTAVWLGRDPLIQRLMICEAQNITGAQVEMAQVRSSISNGKLFFKDLKIADPRSPMNNLVQADMAYVQLNPELLLRRQFVIEQGQTSELIFGAPRTDSGALPETQRELAFDHKQETTAGPNPHHDYETELANKGQLWLDRIPPYQSVSDIEDFEIVKLARDSLVHWDEQLATHRAEVARINPAITKLQAVLKTNSGNPLRDPDRDSRTREDLKRLEDEAAQIRNSIHEMQMKVSQEKQALINAKTRDQQKLRQMTPTNLFDSESMSQLMLYRSQAQLVEEVVQWFRWFRTSLPDPYQHLNAKSKRGVKVAFKGVAPQPGFLIKQLDLEGEGRFANQHLNFAGTAYNLSTQPSLHSEPTSFELRAQGSQHVIVNCEIDRRDRIPVDTLHIQCPHLEIEAQTLGHPNSMLVSMGPASRVQAEINIQMNGDQLSGKLVFRHSQVSLHVDKLHELAGGPDTALRLNQDLAKINQFKTKVSLSGTLDDYQFQFESDLGSMFAATAERVVTKSVEQKLARQKSRLDEILTAAIEKLDRSVAAELAELADQLQRNTYLIAELKESIEAPPIRSWPKIRR